MGTPQTRLAGSGLDLSDRFLASAVVVASPAAAAETIIAQLPALQSEQIVEGTEVAGWAAFTVGTNGTAVRLRVRRTNVAGQVVADTGALTGGVAAAGLLAVPVFGFDTNPPQVTVYVLTLQVTAGSAPSTVSATLLHALAI